MMRIKKRFALIVWLCSLNVNAGLIINSSSGELEGANNVLVNEQLYNVSFRAESFYYIFQNELNLDATSSQSYLFSQALIDQVFIKTPLADFSSSPTLIKGCSNIYNCAILTPYSIELRGANPQWLVDGSVAAISSSASPFIGANIRDPSRPTFSNWVYADWQVVSVSEPISVIMLSIGLFFIMLFRRQ